MGCVYSHAEDHKNRRPPPPPRPTKKRPLPAAVVATKTTNNGRLPGAADLRKPSAITEPNHNVTPSQNANLGAAASSEDMQFRRQHFDRNSVLRRSKTRTRKNSTASRNGSVASPRPSIVVPPPPVATADNSKEDAVAAPPLTQVCT